MWAGLDLSLEPHGFPLLRSVFKLFKLGRLVNYKITYDLDSSLTLLFVFKNIGWMNETFFNEWGNFGLDEWIAMNKLVQ